MVLPLPPPLSGRLRLQIFPNRKQEKLESFVLEKMQPGTEARTHQGYQQYFHQFKNLLTLPEPDNGDFFSYSSL